MFCSNCGNELHESLRYCNRCGARTAQTDALEKQAAALPVEQNKLAQRLSNALGMIGFVGLIAFAVMITNLIRRDEIHPAAFLLVLAFGAVVLAVIFIITRQISILSGKGFGRSAHKNETQKPQVLPRADNTSQLPPFREPIGSVTEHTTRTFSETLAKKTKP
jgi:hypothetical protein